MPMTDIEKIKLELGLLDPMFQPLSDEDYEYFLGKNNNNIILSAQDAAKSIVFFLAQAVREKSDVLELYGDQMFRQYLEALKMFISNAAYSQAVRSASPFAGGISRSDIQANLDNPDNNVVAIERGIPNDQEGVYVNNGNAFTDYNFSTGNRFSKSPFSV